MRTLFMLLCCGMVLHNATAMASDTLPNPSIDPSIVDNDDALLKEINAAIADDAEAQIEVEQGTDTNETASPVSIPINGNEANPAISVILDFAGAWFGTDDHYRQGGHAPNHNGPMIQGAELALSTNIDPWFALDVAFGMFHMHLEEVYLTTTALPWNLQLRAGKYKSAIGRHNPVHLHSWKFVNQPLANEWLFGSEGMSLPGMEISWMVPLPWYTELIGSIQHGSAGAFRSKPISEGEPAMRDFLYPVRLVQFFDINPDLMTQLGINTVMGTADTGPETGNRTFAYGADFLLKWRPTGEGNSGFNGFQWETEFWFRQMEAPSAVWNDLGGYSAFVAGLNKNWETGFRVELWRQLSQANDDDTVSGRSKYGLNAFKLSTVLSYMPSHFSRIRLQHNIESIDGFTTHHSVFLQLEVSGGAHKAHAF